MRHQSRHPSVTVEERVYPQQPVMGGCGCNDGFCLAQAAVLFLKLL
jgi:hypothetical protein